MSSPDLVMRVLIIGGSGFIGKKLVHHAPRNIVLTYSYFSYPIADSETNSLKLDLMDEEIIWDNIIEGYDAIIISARPNGHDRGSRDATAVRTAKGFSNLINAIERSNKSPFLLAIHGSLSYGDRRDDLVHIHSKINPIGFAQSYAIGERPIREYLVNSGDVAIIRAPWVLGNGSWYQSMYLAPKNIPLLSKNPWMSIVDVDDLAQSAWDILLNLKPGIYHSKLTYRCKQNEFATIVNSVSKKPLVKQGWIKLLFYEKQMRESILASIKIDDSRGNASEENAAKIDLIGKITKLHSGF